MKSNHWVMDYETMINVFVAVFQHYKDPSLRRVFVCWYTDTQEINEFENLVNFLIQNRDNNEWHISFNGLAFDSQISEYILQNKNRLLSLNIQDIITEIYYYAQSVIDKSNRKVFLDYPSFKLSIKQIDVFKLNHWDNRAKMSGLKWIQYSMDWNSIVDMPYKHNETIESRDKLNEIISYCINDVLSTQEVFSLSKEQIKLRQDLSKEYGIDLYNASETKISKELFLHFLNKKLGIDKKELKTLRTPRSHIILAECILPYISFKTPEFNEILKSFQRKVITSTKEGFKFSLKYKNITTDYGLGGIHGAISSGVYVPKDGWTIITSDVKSFYPNLAIRNKLSPAHIPQKEFCELYEWFYDERIKIPKSDPKNYVYKIILNSTYGLSGDENSFLYDPKFTMQITVNGQLSLSMLYESICEEIPEAIPLMQNTDGLETMIPNSQIKKYMEICEKWCKLTNLELDHDEYSKMIIRDVNNYLAVYKKTGEVKCKGFYEWEDLEKKKVSVLHKNKSFLVVSKAIYEYFKNGIKPEDYLKSNKNILDYCAGVKVKGDWRMFKYEIKDGVFSKEETQRIVRYYISNKGCKLVKENESQGELRQIQIEAGEWLQTIVNKDVVGKSTDDFDINYKYYLDAIYKEIEQLDKPSIINYTQLNLF